MKNHGTGPTVGAADFNAYYFEHCCGRPYKRDEHWVKFFSQIADRIVEHIHPRRVLDAGCAMGLLVEALRTRGVEADGIDISPYAIDNVTEAMRPFCRVASIADELPERYDLIISIEVLEHMPPADGEAAIANICRHTDDVLFSSTPGDYCEPTHVNVQAQEYWAEQFARHGFFRDVDFDASFVTSWAVRFRRMAEPLPRLVRNYERRFAALSLERNDRRRYAIDLQGQLAGAEDRLRLLDQEREAERAAFEAERAAFANERGTFEGERAAFASERASLQGELGAVRAALEAAQASLTNSVHQAAELEAARAREAAGRASLEDELTAVRVALEATHANLTEKVVELDASRAREAALRAESDQRGHALAHALATIDMMKTSFFWRLRTWLGRR